MSRRRGKYDSMYWRQFLLTAGMVLLTLALLGVSFFALSYNYAKGEKSEELQSKAEMVGKLAVTYLEADGAAYPADLQQLASFAASVSDVDFLVCNTNGNVLLTTDEGLEGQVVTLPEELTNAVLQEGLYEGRSRAGGLYKENRFMLGVPAVSPSSGRVVGLVFAVTEISAINNMWRAFAGLFFMTSIVVLMLAFVASSVVSMQQTKPIQDMLRATRQYAQGNFDIRMEESTRNDEIAELARSFNAMADSLQQTERQRREFIANISHELKTPMTTIGGFVDGILDGTIPEEKHHQYLEVVSGEVKRLSRMVRSMLDLAKIEAGEMKLNPAEFDLNSTVCQVIFSFEQAIEAKRLDVIGLDVDKVMVSADPDLMHQVIYNLIDNAVKFVNEDGYIEVKYHSDGARTLVAIRNSGAGIAAQDLPNVFERFYKTDRSRSKDKTGVGLGLYIVRTVIRLHGGEIHVSSKEGEYTEFAFSIPSSGTKSSQNLFRKNG